MMYGRGGVDVFDPDYRSNPLFSHASCFDGVVSPGEFIFYPGDWWHATRNLGDGPSIAVSALAVNADNFRRVQEVFEYDCTGHYPSNLPGELCARLPKCFQDWAALG